MPPVRERRLTRKRPEPGQPTVSEHLVARPEPRNAFAHRFDPPRHVGAQDLELGLEEPRRRHAPWRGLRVKSAAMTVR